MLGIDISSNNTRPIPWKDLKDAGVGFVIIKCTEGLTYTNPYFAQDVQDAQKEGMQVAAYHFLHPDLDGAAQARFAQDVVRGVDSKMAIWPDVEIMSSNGFSGISLCVTNFFEVVGGGPKRMYSNPYYYSNLKSIGCGVDWLWLANPSPALMDTWSEIVMTQDLGPSSISGYPVDVDRCVRNMPGMFNAGASEVTTKGEIEMFIAIESGGVRQYMIWSDGTKTYIPDTNDLNALNAKLGPSVSLTVDFLNTITNR